jgi:hypothetical protein
MTRSVLRDDAILVRDALLSFMTKRRVKSQSEFARASQVSPGLLCDVIQLRRNLSPQSVERITKAYSMTRRQAEHLNYCAARAAGWKLPELTEAQRIAIVAPDPDLLHPERSRHAHKEPKTLGRTKRKVVVVNAKPKIPKPKKPPPARVLAVRAPRVAVTTVPPPDMRPTGFTPPTLEALTADIERELA